MVLVVRKKTHLQIQEMKEIRVSIPRLGRSPGGGYSNPFQYSCLENPHGQRSLGAYSPWGHKESDTTEATGHIHSTGSRGQPGDHPDTYFSVRYCSSVSGHPGSQNPCFQDAEILWSLV